MLFNSIDFLIYFPIVVILYFVLPHKIRWIWLLGASVYFYMCWKAKYILLMGFSIGVTWLGALLMDWLRKESVPPSRTFSARHTVLLCRILLILVLLANLGVLFLFKYYNFFAENLNALAGTSLPALGLLLPVGISFYTFQALGYSIDVYRREIPAEKNPFRYALFVCFFPQLVAGPIERTAKLLPQLKAKASFDYERMVEGALLIGWGLFCKLVVADRLAVLVNTAYDNAATTDGALLLLATILFAIQIYCDFGSYSEIARGAALVLGIRLMKNFDLPYFSHNLAEFWQRWHISLSQWFMDYIYTPVVWCCRSPITGAYLGLIVVFLVSGLWHGAAWTYVAWGILHAIYRVVGAATKKPRRKLYKKLGIPTKSKWFAAGQVVVTFALVDFTYIFFRASTLEQAFLVIQQILFNFHLSVLWQGGLLQLGLSVPELVVAAISIFVLWGIDLARRKTDLSARILAWSWPARWSFGLALIAVLLIFGVYGPKYEAAPFIYFQF